MSDTHERCLHPERWATIQAQLAEITSSNQRIVQQISELHARLFVDNGRRSIQSELVAGIARFEKLETRVGELEQKPAQLLGMAATISTIITAAGGAILWLFGMIHGSQGK